MKKILWSLLAVLLCAVACDKYDDSALSGRVDDLESRVAALEQLCKQLNTNISSLQTIVSALESADYIVSVTPITEAGEEIGYTITFAKSPSITIYHGKNGQNGKDGKDGADGKDGYTPQIGVQQDADGVYYWTLDGSWLTDAAGNKIRAIGQDGASGQPGDKGDKGDTGEKGDKGDTGEQGDPGANGADGITPQLKIDGGYWYVSTDNGATWTLLGKATGENGKDGKDGTNGQDGKDGDSMFQSVTQDDAHVYFTLSDGTVLTLPKQRAFAIEFTTERATIVPGERFAVRYTVTAAADAPVMIETVASAGVTATVVPDAANALQGAIEIAIDQTVGESSDAKVLIFATDGATMLMRRIAIEALEVMVDYENEATTASTAQLIEAEGNGAMPEQELTLTVLANVDPVVEIAYADESEPWIHPVVESRALERRELKFRVDPNEGDEDREAEIRVSQGVTFKIRQKGRKHREMPTDMEEVFPDPVFRECVLASFDTNHDGRISEQEALAVIRITLPLNVSAFFSGEGVTTLKGVEYFTNLQRLDCTYHQLTELDVTHNPALTYLDCGMNHLTSLDVTKNPALETLQCFNNPLTGLDLSQNPVLKDLKCYHNEGKIALDVTKNPMLEILWCYDNQMTELDLSHNPALKNLRCYDNQLTELDVTQNPALTYLDCRTNYLTSLDVTKNSALTYLDCRTNYLTSLDVTKNSALKSLYCVNNQLTELDVTKNPALESLYCDINQLTELDVTQNPALKRLDCYNNQLTELDVTQNPVLEWLYCYNNQLTALDLSKTNLSTLDCAPMQTLKTVYLKKGWSIRNITEDNGRSSSYIPDETEIVFVD